MTLKEKLFLAVCGFVVGSGAGKISTELGATEYTMLLVTLIVAIAATAAFFLLYKRLTKSA